MKKSCFSLILLLSAVVVLSATKIEIESDKSATAEITENKEKQLFSLSLTFMPVTTLDAVTNDKMTEVLAQFLAKEALSSFLKKPKAINFFKTKCILLKKTEKVCSLTYEIPASAIVNATVKQQTISSAALKKCLTSASADTVFQNFRSTCFHDLRIAENLFLEQIKSVKHPDKLAGEISKAFSALKEKINNDDALFLSEKEDLLSKAISVEKFLQKKLSEQTISATQTTEAEQRALNEITHAKILPEFKPFLLSDPILLDIGGCKAFQTNDGKTVLIAVGYAEVKDQSPKDRIRRQKIAEQRAFGELAKHQEVEVVDFSELHEAVIISSKDRSETGSLQKSHFSRTTVKAEAYFEEMLTVGQWYSKDEKLFYLAKGCMIPQK